MKKLTKSLVAVAILGTFLTACDDKKVGELTQKLQQSEQNVAQLTTQLADSKKLLTEAQAKVQSASQSFPALQVGSQDIFVQNKMVKLAKPKDDVTDASLEYNLVFTPTKVEWLDKLLLSQLFQSFHSPVEKKEDGANSVEQFKQLLQQAFNADEADLVKGETFAIERQHIMSYLGQRNQVVSFAIGSSLYTGGAHNNYWTNFYNIDVEKKAVISLNDIIAKEKQAMVTDMLWELYKATSEKGETAIEKSEFSLSPDFYFAQDGIHFVYPPYGLGSYAEGEKELVLLWEAASELVNPKYQW